jgi:PKD repeat protein
MAISVAFVGVPVTGSSPLGVQYTDNSLGSPDAWLWSFGDGETSEEQHPFHTYLNDGNYTVKLTAYKKTGTSFPWVNPISAVKKEGSGSTNQEAYDNFVAASFVNDPGGESEWNAYFVDRLSASNYVYFARKITYNPNLVSSAGKVIIARMSYEVVPDDLLSGASMPLGGLLRVLPDGTISVLADVTSYGGSQPTFEVSDFLSYPILPDLSVGGSAGWAEQFFGTVAYSYSELGTLEKASYISVGAICVANGWAVLNSSKVPRVPSGFDLVVNTDHDAHLFARYMPEVPKKTTTWKVKYGMKYRCYPVFDMLYSGEVEQSEAGETKVHTFDMSIMPASETLVIVLHGTQCSVASASRGPLMMYDNTIV